jgi:hypothetical protein
MRSCIKVLSLETHVKNITSNAQQRVGTSFSGFLSFSVSIMPQTFIMHIRPILIYNRTKWIASHVYATRECAAQFY